MKLEWCVAALSILLFLPTSIYQYYTFRMGTKMHKFRPSIYHCIFFSRDERCSGFSFCHSSTNSDSFFLIAFPYLKLFKWGEWNMGLSSAFPKPLSGTKGTVILDLAYATTSVNSFIALWNWGLYPQWIHFSINFRKHKHLSFFSVQFLAFH